MSTRSWLEISLTVQCVMAILVVALMARRKSLKIFPWLAWLVGIDSLSSALALLLLFFHNVFHIDSKHRYFIWFVCDWFLSTSMLVLRICAVYGVFAEAMRPMSGLHQAGKIIFRWVGVVSLLVALALLAGPGAFSGVEAWLNIVSRLQQGVSVLTLCLLVFVCFAARPLGLIYRSYLFGVSLGLGVAATVELIQAAWVLTAGAQSMYSPIFLFSSMGFCVALTVWGTYFALPEPPRKMILLPTTSPFFFWNRISEILGDSPGQVAVAGFTPDMLAPAELEMFIAATAATADSVEPGDVAGLNTSENFFEAAEVPSDTGEDASLSLPERPTLAELGVTSHPHLAV